MGNVFVLPNKVNSKAEGRKLFDKLNQVCMKFLEEPVNYVESILDYQLLSVLNRKRESLFPQNAISPAAKNFTALANKISELSS